MDSKSNQPQMGKSRLHEEAELPIDGLPEVVQALIKEVVRCYCCPMEFPTVAAIAASATAVGRRVKTFDGVYTNPLMLWFVNVANSGMNKTAPVKRVLEPLAHINQENYEAFKLSYAAWKADKDRDEAHPPLYEQLLINDTTDEARTQVLKTSRTGALDHHPEIKGFFDDLDRYTKSGSIARVINLYDGNQIIVNRKTDPEPIVIPDPFMVIIGDLQPQLLDATFGSEMFRNNGLNQRITFTMPNIVEFPRRHEFHFNEDIMQAWEAFIRNIYIRDYNTFEIIRFSEPCMQLYNEFHDHLQELKEENTDDGYILSIYSKLQIQCQRLAGIVHVMEMVNPRYPYDFNYISAQAMEYAIRCMKYFEKSAFAVYNRINGVTPLSWGRLTQEQIIYEFSKRVTITHPTYFAKGISKQPSYISKVMKGKGKP